MKKDEAIAKIGELEAKIAVLELSDQKIRESMSVALGAGTFRKNSYDDEKQIVYSWYAIFREVGKLLARKDHADFVDEVNRLRKDFHLLTREFENLQNSEEPYRKEPF